MTTVNDLIGYQEGLWFMNVRGTNGAGKSSMAKGLILREPSPELIMVDGLKKVAYNYLPSQNILIVGNYKNQCGGCDNLVKAQIVPLLKLAWLTDCNVLFEGVLVANSKLPYMHLMQELDETTKRRKYGFIYLDIPVQTCLDRIQIRNGGKEINEELVIGKHRDAIRYRTFHEQQPGLITLKIDADDTREVVFERFLDCLSQL